MKLSLKWFREENRIDGVLKAGLARAITDMGICSQDTANRDIDDLLKRGILIKSAEGGRSTSYSLAPPFRDQKF